MSEGQICAQEEHRECSARVWTHVLQVCLQATVREEQKCKQEGLLAFGKRRGFANLKLSLSSRLQLLLLDFIDVVFNDH